MKRNILKVLVPLLCAAILFGGCAAALKKTEDATSAPSQTQTETDAAQTATNGASAESVTTSDLFSARDLSADYDGEATEIRLNGASASANAASVSVSGSTVTITGAGTYLLTGSLTDGSVIVDAAKEDKVQLVLSGADIHSDSYAAIYVKQADKVFITLAAGTENSLSNGGSFTQRDENDVDAAVYARDDLTFNGTGSLTVSSPAGHGIVGKDEVTITGGVYTVNAAQTAIRANDSIAIADGTFTLTAGTDGLHAENNDDDTLGDLSIVGGQFTINAQDDAIHATTKLQIDGGSFDISAAEGLEATYIQINGGEISISASDDGVNAARKSSAYTPTVEITGGSLTIEMGAGDTDGVDSNGNLIISGGTVSVNGSSAFDYDGTVQFTGGTVIVNGQQVDTISGQMMGGGRMKGGMPGGRMGAMPQDGMMSEGTAGQALTV